MFSRAIIESKIYCVKATSRTRLFVLLCLMLAPVLGHAQGGMLIATGQTESDEVAQPKPGGHDYQHFASETVNPSNGSVSYRIQYPMPKGRGLTLPYWFSYSSAGQYRLEYQLPEENIVFLRNYFIPPAEA